MIGVQGATLSAIFAKRLPRAKEFKKQKPDERNIVPRFDRLRLR